jgi:glycosyltransferase involved in cell wall biosynthesis
MGLELAEMRLLEALPDATDGAAEVFVAGGRAARRHAARIGARWAPARPGRLPRRASSGADLVHLLGLDLPPPRATPFVATVHDLAPHVFDDEGSLPTWLDSIVEGARLFLTPSAFTAGELESRLGVPAGRIRVIGGAAALDARDALPLDDRELGELGIEPPLVLRYGGYTARKNVPLLLEAWAQVQRGTLVLAGPPQPARQSILAEAPSLDRVVVLDYVTQTLLARMLRTASAFVSVSTYEGFGLPPLEAMLAGTPVVAVSAPFVTEVCGEAAVVVDAGTGALAQGIRRVLDDGDLASRLSVSGQDQAARQTWPRAAARVAAAYRDAVV